MKTMACVELMAEKYTEYGVHKDMQGWSCLDNNSNRTWLVNVPQCGEKDDIAEISIKEDDLEVIPAMNAAVNEKIMQNANVPKPRQKVWKTERMTFRTI